MPQQHRRLEDLYKPGKVHTIDDGEGPVKVWVRRPNPNEYESIARRASAAQARFMRLTDDQESDEWMSVYQGVRSYGDRDALVSVIIADDVGRAKARIEAETEAKDEWSKDGYLQSLTDAWVGTDGDEGLEARHMLEPDDPECQRVLDELKRFDAEANKLLEAEKIALRDSWSVATDEEVYVEATNALVRKDADKAYRTEYQYQQIFYGTFEVAEKQGPDGEMVPCAGSKYFGTMDPVRDLSEATVNDMTLAIGLLGVGPIEGKDSPAPPASSPEPEPAATEEASAPSGPVEQPA